MATVLEDKRVKATRKAWPCDGGCGRRFEAGTPKNVQKGVYDGEFYTWRACDTCREIVRDIWLNDPQYRDEGVSDEEVYEEMMEKYGSWEEADRVIGERLDNARKEAVA